ncbi:hypothetical protein J2Z72_000325 [Peptostreptococcus canis]|nr:hypothetical protein [Peptostreptococcus canis]
MNSINNYFGGINNMNKNKKIIASILLSLIILINGSSIFANENVSSEIEHSTDIAATNNKSNENVESDKKEDEQKKDKCYQNCRY